MSHQFLKGTAQESAALAKLLAIQTECFGKIDLPAVLRVFEQEHPSRVLDLGTGDGSFLSILAATAPRIQFIGIDIDSESIERAREKTRHLTNVRVQVTQATLDEFSPIDMAISRLTLQHVQDVTTILRGVYGVLRPGGTLLIIDPLYDYYDCHPPSSAWHGFRDRMIATYRLRGSDSGLPKTIALLLAAEGYVVMSSAAHFYSPQTMGLEAFIRVVSATIKTMKLLHPGIWDFEFCNDIDKWLNALSLTQGPSAYITLVHTIGMRPC